MMLYHGTKAALLTTLTREGILPREMQKKKSRGNWTHTITSNRKAIYLTDAYPGHFASVASGKTRGLILEIDRGALLPWLLCPDEDMLEQLSRNVPSNGSNNLAPGDWSMAKRTRYYRQLAPMNPKLADKSLEMMGTCGYYGPISWKAVRRYVIVDWEKLVENNPVMFYMACDTMVSVMNYKVLKTRHRELNKWFFGESVDPLVMCGFEGFNFATNNELDGMFHKQLENMTTMITNREALEIVDVPKQAA
jgi:hypothetical protein